jgi:cytochrome c553
MHAKLEFSAIAGPLLAASLLLSLPSARAHHEGGQHEVAKSAQAGAAEAANAGARADTLDAPSDAAAGARLAATCTGCHGTDGRTVGDALPPLAGQPKQALLANLLAFKSGNRSATVMTQLARGYSDADLERIAAFFASQPQPAREGPGS